VVCVGCCSSLAAAAPRFIDQGDWVLDAAKWTERLNAILAPYEDDLRSVGFYETEACPPVIPGGHHWYVLVRGDRVGTIWEAEVTA
jgi:hypothetical protein